jgi:hypothetical protein
MHQLLLDAAAAHPERAEFDRVVAAGVDRERAAKLLSTQKPLTLRTGASTWCVQNNPAKLEAHAETVAKCPGFSGKRTPKPRSGRGTTGGVMYRHADGFKLLVPHSLIRYEPTDLIIGQCKLRLLHKAQVMEGRVPDTWLVDLNAGPLQAEVEEEPQGVEDLL